MVPLCAVGTKRVPGSRDPGTRTHAVCPGSDRSPACRTRGRGPRCRGVALALPGSVYLYQGEELGLPEADIPP
ncbi:hypothetical protein ABT157_21860, partial [Streptomyces viridosporus]